MKYKNKDITDAIRNKNWEGLRLFVERFGMGLFVALDRIIRDKDLDKLKEFVKRNSMEPLVEYGLPLEGEVVKELYEISERFHGHKHKTGAEWWVRDEVEAAVRQLRGYASSEPFLDGVALLWKEVDEKIQAPEEIKVSAFRKVLMLQLIRGIFRPEFREEKETMEKIIAMCERSGFTGAIGYQEAFTE
jgi:hypothetical protein